MMDRLQAVGVLRTLDELGRLTIAKEYRDVMCVRPGTQLLHTLVVDGETGRVRGVLLQPTEWVTDPASAPLLRDALQQLREGRQGR